MHKVLLPICFGLVLAVAPDAWAIDDPFAEQGYTFAEVASVVPYLPLNELKPAAGNPVSTRNSGQELRNKTRRY